MKVEARIASGRNFSLQSIRKSPFEAFGRDRFSDGVLVSDRSARRLLLIILLLAAFLRLAWQLEAKNLWWDESLTLQRAESDWPALLMGRIVLTDGQNLVPTLDQHPFLFFVLERIGITLAGQSEFVLRFPALVAAALLVPMSWTLARLLVRRKVLPPGAPMWAALLAAINPFYLWYGQEARAYTLAPLLVLLSTYLLLRAVETSGDRRRFWAFAAAYVLSALALLATHYLVVLALPVQLALIVRYFFSLGHRRAAVILGSVLAFGLIGAALAAYVITRVPTNGTNFASVSLKVLIPDLLNAFSLGLSVNIDRVRWLDYIIGGLALLGALWGVRGLATRSSPARPAPDAWLLPAIVIAPVLGLQVVQLVRPAYMNARHMSFITGAFLMLVAGGLAWAWSYRRWLGAGLAALIIAGSLYSTRNYFTLPEYDKDQLALLGQDLRQQLQPGDAVVVVPSEMLRLYRYYLPLDELAAAASAGQPAGWQAMPLYQGGTPAMEQRFVQLARQYRRIWLATSGMVPLNPGRKPANAWLPAHAFQVGERGYHANTNLKLKLFLPQSPILSEMPPEVQHTVAAGFGDHISLQGYEIGKPLLAGTSAIPITLYWQTSRPNDRRYKYVLRLVAKDGDEAERTLAISEREPYDGALPTTQWQPGQTIREYGDLARPEAAYGTSATDWPPAAGRDVFLTLQVYDAETLAKLPVTAVGGGTVAPDGNTLILPYGP